MSYIPSPKDLNFPVYNEYAGKKMLTNTVIFIQEKWLPALRSGRYLQSENSLRLLDPKSKKYRYCCLGVACNLQSRHVWSESVDIDGTYNWRDRPTDSTTALFDSPKWPMPGLHSSISNTLAEANDSGSSFEEIADYIENEIVPRLQDRILALSF